MRKHFNIVLGLLFFAVLGLAALQGGRVQHLRQSEAFYRWILAAATQERMAWGSSSTDYKDNELYGRVADAMATELPEMPAPADSKTAAPLSKLGRVAGGGQESSSQNDPLIWKLAQAESYAPLRNDFLSYARDGRLEFSKDIQYAEAQASGVSIFNLFFGFRKIAANMLWLQVDRYWHSGYLFRMVPMMRTVVALDPNFIDAYLIGAWHIAYNATAKMLDTPPQLRKWHPVYKACIGEKETYYYLAADFLKDGIRKNPRSYKLYFDLGFAVYKEKLKDYGNAVRYLSEAIRQPHDRWVPRQLYICQELNGEYEKALAGWQDYKERFPDTSTTANVVPRFIERNTGMIFERRWKEALDKAKNAATPEEAEAARKEAADYRERATKSWFRMKEDPFGIARIARLQAIDLRDAGRYHEAIARLDQARYGALSSFWDEGSDMIIEIKQQAGFPLSVSEQKAVMRRQEGERCEGCPEGEGEAQNAAPSPEAPAPPAETAQPKTT